MKKSDVVAYLLPPDKLQAPKREGGVGFAPTNIALCKYWGKRDVELNLPVTSSLSIALPDRGALTRMKLSSQSADIVILNGETLSPDSAFVLRLERYLNLFRKPGSWYLEIHITMSVPVAAGLASSACGFASLVFALNDLFDWQCSLRDLSILARCGSGSAARSFWSGFVEWHRGHALDGMDCYAEPLDDTWPDFCVGLLTFSTDQKPLSSSEAMQRTTQQSKMYQYWPSQVSHDLSALKLAIQEKNFSLMGKTAESNALIMHAMMLGCAPPICYILPATLAAMHRIWALRKEGLELYFTEDAGPNLKLLFLEKNSREVRSAFPELDIIQAFSGREEKKDYVARY